MNSCASSPNFRMSDWENRPTNARCPDKKICELGTMVQSHYSNKPSLDATCRWPKTWGTHVDRRTVCIEYVGPRFSRFFFQFFSFFLFFGGEGGGWVWAKASVILPKFLPPSLSRKYAFFWVWEAITQKRDRLSPNLVQWCIIPKNRFEKNLAFVTSKMRIQEFFFPLHTADAYANVPNCDALTCTLFWPSGVFIYLF